MKKKKKVVLTGGKFNHIHAGHLYLLKKCKALGNRLVVVLSHDRHNRKPYAVPARQRKKNVEKLKIADKVVIGDPDSFAKVVYRFKPNIIVLGYDQKLPDAETKEASEKINIKIVKLRRYGKYRTKKLIQII